MNPGTEIPGCVCSHTIEHEAHLFQQKAEQSDKGSSVSEPKTKRLPRRLKKQLKKERPAGALSSTPNRAVKISHRWKARHIATSIKRIMKTPEEKVLASVAHKFSIFDKKEFERIKSSGDDPSLLALEITSGAFVKELVKYKGFDPAKLMEQAIVYARIERPVAVTPPAVVKPKKPRLTARQELQSAQSKAARVTPSTMTASPKKRPRKRTSRRVNHDPQVVQSALDALFDDNPELKATFCSASIAEAKQLLRTTRGIERLAASLREQLASPTRVYNYLDTAARILIPKYQDEELKAEQEARENAEARRQERKVTSIKTAQDREIERQKLERRREDNRRYEERRRAS